MPAGWGTGVTVDPGRGPGDAERAVGVTRPVGASIIEGIFLDRNKVDADGGCEAVACEAGPAQEAAAGAA